MCIRDRDAIEPSPHDPAKAFACILRYQLGDWKPYIYRTANYGRSWNLITDGIPDDHPCRVIREDPNKQGHLYAGTEYGLYMSMDDGSSWHSLQHNLPVTPITDIRIHRGDLVMSTMGRSFWILDNISTLSQMQDLEAGKTALYKPRDTYRYRYPSGARISQMPQYPRPAVIIDYSLSDSLSAPLKLEVINSDGAVINTFFSDSDEVKIADQVKEDMSTNRVEYIVDNSLSTDIGLNRYRWDMTEAGPWHKDEDRRYKNGPLAPPGDFTIRLTVGDEQMEQSFQLLMDPRLEKQVSIAEVTEQVTLHRQVKELFAEARRTLDDLETEKKALAKNKEQTAEEKERTIEVEELIAQLKTKEGIYELPQLVDQISYLYNLLGDTDQMPGQDAFDRYEELKSVLESMGL